MFFYEGNKQKIAVEDDEDDMWSTICEMSWYRTYNIMQISIATEVLKVDMNVSKLNCRQIPVLDRYVPLYSSTVG